MRILCASLAPVALAALVISGCRARGESVALASAATETGARTLTCTPSGAKGVRGTSQESLRTSAVGRIAKLTVALPAKAAESSATTRVAASQADGSPWEAQLGEGLDLYGRSGEIAMVSGAIMDASGTQALTVRVFFEPGTDGRRGFVEFNDGRGGAAIQGVGSLTCN